MNDFFNADPLNRTAFPIARPGLPFIYVAAFTTLIFALLGFVILSLVSLTATFFICYFFRDPDRVTPNGEGLIVSPADGKIITITSMENTPYYDGACQKISIFMNVFNVHVNRIPHEGQVQNVRYHPGKFLSANLDKASAENEHNAVFIDTPHGKITVVQIAGLIARRIICYLQPGDNMNRGQRFGMICFGSRLDVYLPPDATALVNIGDKVKSGYSVLGKMGEHG